MRKKSACIVVLLTLLWTFFARAEDVPGVAPGQEQGSTPLAVTRSVVYFPFKGVICAVGTVAFFPAYVLSGLDPQVKIDTEAQRNKYCSQNYLFSPEWPR